MGDQKIAHITSNDRKRIAMASATGFADRVKRRPWLKWISLSLGIVVVIATISELARPGTMLCPLRRTGEAMGIPMEKVIPGILDRYTKEDSKQAAKEAAKWKAAALEKFPNLRIEAHPLPPQENGFRQLCLLEKNPPHPTAELRDLPGVWEEFDGEKARTALAANGDWVKRIESIAGLPGRSSIDLPDGPVWFFPVSPVKQALETLLLQSVLAAQSKDEPGALRAMKAAGNLIDHLHKVETPTLLTQTACILCHRLRLKVILNHVLPAIGPSADLDAWEKEMGRMKISPSQLAVALRGEWHAGCDTMTYPMIALSHRQRRLIDPEAVAMAYAETVSRQIGMLQSIKPQDAPNALKSQAANPDLSHEGRDILELLDVGLSSWARGYLYAARVDACHKAAMDLLQVEPCQGDLCAHDAERITLDPLTGKPFDFDPDTRTLSLPEDGFSTGADEPVKLPWKAGY